MGFFIFTQLAGDRKELKLTGDFGPQGGPRQQPVVTDAITVRQTEVYYPGNPVPTRHLFGTREEPWEINGRFSDRRNRRGFATTMAEYCKQFVADQQQVEIAWNGIVAVHGIIEQFSPARESEFEIAWTMRILIDEDLLRINREHQPVAYNPFESLMLIEEALAHAWDKPPNVPPTMKVGILDWIASLVSMINSPVAVLANIVNQIDTFEQTTYGELRRLQGSLTQLRTTAHNAARVLGDNTVEKALLSANTEDSLTLWDQQHNANEQTLFALAEIQTMEDQAKHAQLGMIKGTYIARNGDTWESIATAQLGSADRAVDIQNINLATENPVPGTQYLIPR